MATYDALSSVVRNILILWLAEYENSIEDTPPQDHQSKSSYELESMGKIKGCLWKCYVWTHRDFIFNILLLKCQTRPKSINVNQVYDIYKYIFKSSM